MAEERKSKPSLVPVFTSLQDSVRDAIAKRDYQAKDISVTLRISGGPPSRTYYFDFRVSTREGVHSEMKCEITGRQGKSEARTLKEEDYGMLLRKILDSRVLDLPQEQLFFLPDTLVGVLEISDGESVHRLLFAADPAQAKVQNKTPRPEVKKLVDTVYKMAAQLMNMESVEP